MINAVKSQVGLYNCLPLMLGIYDNSKSIDDVLAGSYVEANELSLKEFLRISERAGINTQLTKISLQKLFNDSLPAIIFLSDDEVIFATGTSEDSSEVLTTSLDGKAAESSIPKKEILSRYLGIAVLIKPLQLIPEETDADQGKDNRNWFWKVVFKSWRIYRDVLVASFLINTFALASPLFIMNVYDRVVPNHAIETLWVLVSGVFIIFAFDLVLRLLRGYFVDISGRRVDMELSTHLYEHVLGIRMANRPASVGAFANHLDEFESIRNFITSATVTTLIDLPFVFLFLFVIWFVGGSLVLVPVLAIPLILLYAILLQPMIRISVHHVLQGAATKNATLVESLVGIETVKLLGAEKRQQNKWEKTIDYISRWSVKSRLLSASVVDVAVFVQQMASISVVAYGVYLIADGSLSLGGLIAGVILTSRVLAPMAQVANLATHYHRVVSAMGTITNILQLPVERNPEVDYIVISKVKGEIEFDKVSFQYPEQSSNSLENITFKINPGERVGIIGRTGSGKSTIGKLIAGLYKENSGFVRIDGIDVRQLDPTEIINRIGYVPQDVILFSSSIRENIIFGCPTTSDDKLIKAAELSDAISIIKKHPSGFDMPVGERGMSLSGGQRQRVAIARAVLNDPPIIIMDEPTNSMDNISEQRLINNMKPYLQEKTFILITHKSSMLELVDRLIVVDEGRVIADGEKNKVINALKTLHNDD